MPTNPPEPALESLVEDTTEYDPPTEDMTEFEPPAEADERPEITDWFEVVTFDEDVHDGEDSLAAGVYVVGGEYASDDSTEVLIRVHFALDGNGDPATEHVAGLIASALSHRPVELQRKNDLIDELRKRDEVHRRVITRLRRELAESRASGATALS